MKEVFKSKGIDKVDKKIQKNNWDSSHEFKYSQYKAYVIFIIIKIMIANKITILQRPKNAIVGNNNSSFGLLQWSKQIELNNLKEKPNINQYKSQISYNINTK